MRDLDIGKRKSEVASFIEYYDKKIKEVESIISACEKRDVAYYKRVRQGFQKKKDKRMKQLQRLEKIY